MCVGGCVCGGGGGGDGGVSPALVKVYDVFPWLMYGQCPFVYLKRLLLFLLLMLFSPKRCGN